MGKRFTGKTSEGIRIVALGGTLDPNIIVGASKDKYPPYYGESDAKMLLAGKTADILITNEWPKGITKRSKVELNTETPPTEQECIAELAATLKPRYHFSTSGSAFFEREPFFHTPSEETDGLYQFTRFISLASFNNPNKAKWIYAFSLDPTASHPVSVPTGTTASPLTLTDSKKRTAPEQGSSGLVYEESGCRGRGGGHRSKRRRGDHRGPLSASECFFCLSNDNIATHLITSIGDAAYLTTAKGPLPTSSTFPGLGFPCHMLIIPLTHQSTLGSMDEADRQGTYAEMQKYRSAMNKMIASRSKGRKESEHYGSVTWEVSKASLPHTHWQYLPLPVSLIRKGLVEAAFKALAENLHWPAFTKEDVGDGHTETSDFFRVKIWEPPTDDEGEDEGEGRDVDLVMRFDESIKFHNQFGREVMAKLLRLDERIDWHDCGQTREEEEGDVGAFKEAFKKFDFAS